MTLAAVWITTAVMFAFAGQVQNNRAQYWQTKPAQKAVIPEVAQCDAADIFFIEASNDLERSNERVDISFDCVCLSSLALAL